MRKPYIDIRHFQDRRRRLAQLIPGSAIVLPAWPEAIRNHDGHFKYRQESNMLYLCGFDEPGSCLIFRPGRNPESILFVRPKNVERETWDGFRFGPEGAKEAFGVDAAYTIDQFVDVAPELLAGSEKIYYSLFKNTEFDPMFAEVLKNLYGPRARAGLGKPPVDDAYSLMGELRIHKTDIEKDLLRRACSISAKAHVKVMEAARPGVSELALQGIFIGSIMEQGAFAEAYTGIFASGDSATTLHYNWNENTLQDGDLLLVDAGAEYQYYSGDITRTYPVSGKFKPAQKRIYERVLKVQEDLIAMCKPGLPHAELQKKTIEWLTEVLIDEKALKGTKEEIIRDRTYMKYYPHGVSHLLGMDTHDAGALMVGGQPREIEPGWSFTIEPGLYFPSNDANLPQELRGIGIRIEDDILITDDGPEVMTAEAPKSVDAYTRV